ncbi:hypothetical protein BDQ12DRAFT_601305 [Crucibulum laeve]|uniref:F-box domain-containing protein n=1 Tax=Crucibulum laeve TaxID=68775 RepID=A0A5C3M5P4_9AGAR|nr:hypothetical protein BDQ12DRAFT_601305 [Crucibulum laeve]
MPSTLRKTQRRALTFSRSLADAIKSKLSTSIFSDKPNSCSPFNNYPVAPPRPNDISRPRNLRRAPIHAFHYVQLHFIHRLPIEILAHIFVLGSEDDFMFPVTVSHVCRSWRNIALNTPSLWRRIFLNPKEHMWRERIRRARACSLDIQLLPAMPHRSGIHRPQYLDLYAVQWYMYIVLPYLHRWRSLEIRFAEFAPYLWNAALSSCCSRNSSQAPLLEELSLVFPSNDDTKEFCLFSGYAPRLRRVTLDGIRLTWLPSLFGNLTFLDYTHDGFTVGHQAVSDVLSILTVSSRLVELRVLFPHQHASSGPETTVPTARRVALPNLTHLQLRASGSDIPFELAHLVTFLYTPSLASLRLVDLGRGFHPFPNLKSFFYVYALPQNLRVLRIENGWYDPRMISPVINSLPLMRQIVIRRVHMQDQVLNLNPKSRTRKGSMFSGKEGHGLHIHRLDVQYLPKR